MQEKLEIHPKTVKKILLKHLHTQILLSELGVDLGFLKQLYVTGGFSPVHAQAKELVEKFYASSILSRSILLFLTSSHTDGCPILYSLRPKVFDVGIVQAPPPKPLGMKALQAAHPCLQTSGKGRATHTDAHRAASRFRVHCQWMKFSYPMMRTTSVQRCETETSISRSKRSTWSFWLVSLR